MKHALSLFLLLAGMAAQSQKLDEATVKQLIASRNFDFVAQTVFPQGGPSRNITGYYDMRVGVDSIVAYLPYFGRAYVATIPPQGGIDFTSTRFNYAVQAGKKKGWDVLIEPKDTKDVRQLTLNVSASGYGTLQVTSSNRQSISYYGYIKTR